MTVSHVAGGGVGALIGAVIAGVLNRYTSIQVSTVNAALIGSAALSVGVGLGHALDQFGVRGILGRVWRGKPAPAAVTVPVPVVPAPVAVQVAPLTSAPPIPAPVPQPPAAA